MQGAEAVKIQLSPPSDEKQLKDDIIAPATKYGYRRITALLNNEYWVESKPQEGRENLEQKRIKGAKETAEKETAMA